MTAMPTESKRRPGRPRCCPDEVLERVIRLRADRAKLREICAIFNSEKIPTPGGRPVWTPKTVHDLLRTIDAEHMMAGRPVGGRRNRAGEQLCLYCWRCRNRGFLGIDSSQKVWKIIPVPEPYSIDSQGFKIALLHRVAPPLDDVTYRSEHSKGLSDVIVQYIEVRVGETKSYE